MRRWILARSSVFAALRGPKPRYFSAAVNDIERVSIRNGSSGLVTIDLHNTAKVSSGDPLLIYLPPYSTAFTDKPAQLPGFIQRQPTAVINYRWKGFSPFLDEDLPASASHESSEEDDEPTHLSWPAPIHDTAKAYNWIVENLSPSTHTRRDIYIYGSYLGASLATSLALTETLPHESMGVRGCVAYNGIYNWTRFLPDHPTNKPPESCPIDVLEGLLAQPVETQFQELRQHAEELFERAENLFDPFASPCLFFHTPDLLVPPSFNSSGITALELLLLKLTGLSEDYMPKPWRPVKSPRKSRLVFPPESSTLEIPETLLLHSTPPPLPSSILRRAQRRKKDLRHIFRTHAKELADLMRISIDAIELEEGFEWDENIYSRSDEANRRVRVHDVGPNPRGFDLGAKGEELAATWLMDHIRNAKSN
ncbi:uncharacterized protein F4822DRAFT_283391 [Hypoxylon trugodes]|uniref:uncharacterized protein n=1 Tax=Hypoxylon trugodes TaxID=326681 RepID=UPI00219A94BC|nr:uncharacterized protein F4822DRAFT_283391 [Hypoxylon trugodes]KAI1387466.1 hypothetical protein F4822DRAFT_283391 [Hypoxylon trugodes]